MTAMSACAMVDVAKVWSEVERQSSDSKDVGLGALTSGF